MTESDREDLKARLEHMKQAGDLLDPPMTFYSENSPTLQLGVSSGRMVPGESGKFERIGEKMVEFSPMPSKTKMLDGTVKHFGYLVTDDPEVALFLLIRGYFKNKFGKLLGDILLPDDYIDRVKPAEEKLRESELRILSSQNELEKYQETRALEQEQLRETEEENRRLRAQLAKLQGKGKNAEEAEKVTA